MAEPIAIVAAISSAVGATAGVVQAVSQGKPVFWDPLMNKDDFAGNVEEFLDDLNEKLQKLRFTRKDLENKVQRNKMKALSETYMAWIRMVGHVDNQVKNLVAQYKKQSKERTSSWFSPCSGISEDMTKMYRKVMTLLHESNLIGDRMFVDQLPERVVKRRGPDIRNFGALGQQVTEILDFLKSSKANKIGIRGTVGIGKTTIMLNLNNHEQVADLFDIVIWLTVSEEGSRKNLERENLQQAIVQRLKLNVGGTSNADEVAERILMELEGKKYLLLLDDVKEYLNLHEKIGIPYCNNGSKIVLTTRLRQVCPSMVDKVIKVAYLSRDDSWKMFQDVLDSPKLMKNPNIRKLARRVCKECSGLPLLIEKVANTFKLKNNEFLWSDGLNSWRSWPEKESQGIREMYKLLKFCYDELDDDHYKKCFLYGALYPEGSKINREYLLECWAAEDFLGNDDGKTKKPLMFGHLILSHLKNVSLLEEGESENDVTMHKFIRQVAIYILEDDHGHECNYMVETSKALREPPDVECWSEKNRISLGDNKLEYLPESPNCSKLSTLFLQKNLSLKTIPMPFFSQMEELRVLDLSDTGIITLPSSLSTLIGLKVLYLNNCKHLVELPSHIVKLMNLEALDILGSGINNIPPHIENLIWLRRLRVSFSKCGNENVSHCVHFNYNIISKLSRLEEMVIDVKSSEDWFNDVVENIIKEVATLPKFRSLKFFFSNKLVNVIELESRNFRIHVLEATILKSFIEKSSWKNVQNINFFEFYIGFQNSEHPQLPNFDDYVKYVKYCEVTGSGCPILEFLAEADAFELVNNKNIKQLSDLEIASMNGIQSCLIESCDAIETIVGTVDSVVLPNLEHLYMKNLPKLESIWKDHVEPGSLTKLTTLVLTNCQILVKIFPRGAIQQLGEIEYLKIEKCQEIEEIIEVSDAVGNQTVLPKLKELILLDMPKLRNICLIDSLQWPSLMELEISKCRGLRKLLFDKNNSSKLKCIKAEQVWWDALVWQNDEVKQQLKEICTLS
ncbi:disease resistance protein At4g27190-like isoform X2 [Actinidia eriantha]|uniref:disease resistance protein At4g27190-like isoform X2 n=1 Tax=Actinidia eriantha TaxID=165200 RepID=UPI00258F9C5C|nr:disease resistance protein At4g27190-like isoform X2 [Actinidia eriantha]